jgi:hypothetical protein
MTKVILPLPDPWRSKRQHVPNIVISTEVSERQRAYAAERSPIQHERFLHSARSKNTLASTGDDTQLLRAPVEMTESVWSTTQEDVRVLTSLGERSCIWDPYGSHTSVSG